MQVNQDESFSHRRVSMLQRKPSPLRPLELSNPPREPDTPIRATPLPVLRIVPLMLLRAAEGMTFTVIFPYVNDMILSFGVHEQDLGFYAGLVESSLMLSEAVTAPLYAPLADKVGRRPVILVLLVFWCIGGFGFGLCTSVSQAVFMRAWLGMLAGCGVLSRTMIGEMCDKTNRIQAFALFTPALTVGMTLGPLLGGLLAKPVPRLLSPSHHLFVIYPYLLPAIVVAAVTALATLSSYLYLTETLVRQNDSKASHGGFKELVGYRPFQNVVTLYAVNNGIMFSWEAIYPLFAYTSIPLGGLGLSVSTIGLILGLAAMLSIGMTAFVFPLMHRRLPQEHLLTLCLLAYPSAVIFFPVIWAVSQNGLGVMGYTLMILQMVLRRMGDFASTLLDTIVLDAIPGPQHLAMANSLVFSMASVARAVGPFVVSWCFALSTQFHNPWRLFVWVAFLGASLPSVFMASNLQKRDKEDAPDEEERHELFTRGDDL